MTSRHYPSASHLQIQLSVLCGTWRLCAIPRIGSPQNQGLGSSKESKYRKARKLPTVSGNWDLLSPQATALCAVHCEQPQRGSAQTRRPSPIIHCLPRDLADRECSSAARRSSLGFQENALTTPPATQIDFSAAIAPALETSLSDRAPVRGPCYLFASNRVPARDQEEPV